MPSDLPPSQLKKSSHACPKKYMSSPFEYTCTNKVIYMSWDKPRGQCSSLFDLNKFFPSLWMKRHSSNSVKGQLFSSERINASSVQSDTHLSASICCPWIAPACLASQSTIDHHCPTGRGGGSVEEMNVDAWLKLSEMTTEPLEQVGNTRRFL